MITFHTKTKAPNMQCLIYIIFSKTNKKKEKLKQTYDHLAFKLQSRVTQTLSQGILRYNLLSMQENVVF